MLRHVRYRCSCRLAGLRQRIRRCRRHSRHIQSRRQSRRHSRHIQSRRQSRRHSLPMPLLVALVEHIPLSIDPLQQLMPQLPSLFGSYFSKLILLFSVYIGCFTVTAKIIRGVTDALIHYNSILKDAFCTSHLP
jgi:hypothetical protein